MKRKFLILPILILLAAALAGVNRDLFHYSYDTRLERTFLPDADEKQDYLISEQIALKPGTYLLSMTMTAEGERSGIFLQDSGGDIFFYRELDPGTVDPAFTFEIEGGTKQVRLGIRYDPERSEIRIQRMRISADHVLYRDSLLRHLTVSAVILFAAVFITLRLCFPKILLKLFPVFSDRRNEAALLILILLTAAACYPLLDGATYVHGEDMFFHLTRIRGLADSLKAGYFPVRDQLYWLHNYGYGVGFFYPDVFLYIPAVLVLLGFHVLTGYKIFLVLCSFCSILTVWYAAFRIGRSRTAGYAAAVLMAFAAYRLSNLYYRGTVGETQAAVFFPLIVLGLYEIFYGEVCRWPLFAFGFLGLLCSHIISLTMAVVLTALFFLTQIGKILRNRQIFSAILFSVLLAAGIGAFFWIPMLEQSITNPGLRVNRLLTSAPRLNRMNYAFPLRNLLYRFRTWSSVRQAESIYPGWSLLAVPFFAVFTGKKREHPAKAADFMLVYALLLLWMCTRSFPWQLKIFLPFVGRIQFAYRLLLPATVLLCICGGIYFSRLPGKHLSWLKLGLLTLFCFFSTAYPVLRETVTHRTVEKNMFIMQDNRVSGAEYLPRKLTAEYIDKNADTVLLSDGQSGLKVTEHNRQKLSFRFRYELPEDAGEVSFSVPLIYYTGFRGTVISDDGTVVTQEIVPDSRGLVSIGNAGFTRGEVFVTYEKTAWQRIGEAVSAVSIISAVLFLRRKRSGNR